MTEWIFGSLALIALWGLFGVKTAKWVASLVPPKAEGERSGDPYELIWWNRDGMGDLRVMLGMGEYRGPVWASYPDARSAASNGRLWDRLRQIERQIEFAAPEILALERCDGCNQLGHRTHSKLCPGAPVFRDALYLARLLTLLETHEISGFSELKDDVWEFTIGGQRVRRYPNGDVFVVATQRELESARERALVAFFQEKLVEEQLAYRRRAEYEEGARGV